MDINDQWLSNPYMMSNPYFIGDDEYEKLLLNPNLDYDIKDNNDDDIILKNNIFTPLKDDTKKEIEGLKETINTLNMNMDTINNNLLFLSQKLEDMKLELPQKRTYDIMKGPKYNRGPYKKPRRLVWDDHGNLVDIGR